ncbi:MAG: hypothetical protein WKG06_04745 [Segetibacter sp.]
MDIKQAALNYFFKNPILKSSIENRIYCKGNLLFSIFIFLYIFFIFISSQKVYGQDKTGANENKASEGVSGGNLTIWAVPAEQKIRPDDAVEINNLVWSKEKKKLVWQEPAMSMFHSRL